MTYPLFSVVIPARNAASTIVPCLQAVGNQTVPRHQYEVIVVDDGSTDGTAEAVRQFIQGQESVASAMPPVMDPSGRSPVSTQMSRLTKLISQPHQGAAAARNAGARMAYGSIILFLDADCVSECDWIARMTQALQRDGVAGVSGVLRTRQRGLMPRFIQAEYDARYRRIAQESHIDFVSSAAAGYHRQPFATGGGFATELGGAEDVDLSYRLSEAGYRLVFEPQAVVYHLHPESLMAYARRKSIYAYWRARVYQRHPQKVASDSRTPFSQKLQIALVPLIILSLGAGLLWPVAWYLAAALAGGFVLTTLPFVIHTVRRDVLVGLVALPVTLVSAVAAAAGLTCGVLHREFTRRTGGKL